MDGREDWNRTSDHALIRRRNPYLAATRNGTAEGIGQGAPLSGPWDSNPHRACARLSFDKVLYRLAMKPWALLPRNADHGGSWSAGFPYGNGWSRTSDHQTAHLRLYPLSYEAPHYLAAVNGVPGRARTDILTLRRGVLILLSYGDRGIRRESPSGGGLSPFGSRTRTVSLRSRSTSARSGSDEPLFVAAAEWWDRSDSNRHSPVFQTGAASVFQLLSRMV